jgi:K+-sensing histidine kinase KdpD
MLCASVVLSAWYGGLGPGLLATALAALIADYHFVHPIHSFDVHQLAGRGVEIC